MTRKYVFDTAEDADARRLDAQAALWDPFTVAVLADAGVGAGWRCLEVGAGTGTVAEWLADRVAAGGRVVVTDVETCRLERLAGPRVEVRGHDLVRDPLEESAFDLVHARLVLEHLPERAAALAKLAAAVRPGGWLVVEDFDLATMNLAHPPAPAWERTAEAVRRVLRDRGVDVHHGRALHAAFRSAGLADVRSDVGVHLLRAADVAPVLGPVLRRVRADVAELDPVGVAAVDEVLVELDTPDADRSVYSPLLVATRGRRPAGPTP